MRSDGWQPSADRQDRRGRAGNLGRYLVEEISGRGVSEHGVVKHCELAGWVLGDEQSIGDFVQAVGPSMVAPLAH